MKRWVSLCLSFKSNLSPCMQRQPVSTLDPQKLTPYDQLDVSNELVQSILLETCTDDAPEPTKFRYIATEDNYRVFHPFPPRTTGFLYLRRPEPPYHPAAGSLRFRVVSKRLGPEAFWEKGQDLLLPEEHGYQPWSIPLLRLRIHPEYRPFYDHLLHSNLVTPEQDEAIGRMLPPPPFHPSPKAIVMEPMDKFYYDFGKEFPNVVFLGEEGIYQHRFRFVPKSRYASGVEESPYSGELHCFFHRFAKLTEGVMHRHRNPSYRTLPSKIRPPQTWLPSLEVGGSSQTPSSPYHWTFQASVTLYRQVTHSQAT
jgi:hypothetical protein